MGLLSKLSIGAIDLPIGPQADARELEYICCLLQTALPDLRDDATISATDIRLYLRSRYGLSVTPDVAIDIVNGLGGGDDERRRRRRHVRRQHQQNLSDVEGCDLVGGAETEYNNDDKASDAHAPTQDSVDDSKRTNDDPCEQVEADEEMGLFESARASGTSIIDSNNTGKVGADKGALPDTSSRQSSLFFDAMESATDVGDGIDTADGDYQEAVDRQAKAGRNGSGTSSALEVNTDFEQSIMTTDDSKRRVQWSKKFPSVSKAPESESPPPVSPSSTNASDNREVYLDLVQVLGSILIPTLIKSKREADIANDIIEEDPPIPDNPEVSFRLLLHQPRQFFANHHESKRLKRKRIERAEQNSLRPHKRLIRDVLIMLVHHVDESNPNLMLHRAQESKDVRKKKSPANNTPRLRRIVISEDFVRDLLLSFGEIGAADDDELIREMVIVAGGDGTVLDELAFARALTSDVLAWTCGMEDGINETFVDVWGFDPVAKNEYDLARTVLAASADVVADAADLAIATGITAAHVATEAIDVVKPAVTSQDSSKTDPERTATQSVMSPKKEEGQGQEGGIKFVHTAHYIDYVCDSFRSLLFQMALYVFYLFSAAIGMSMIGTLNMSRFIKCEPSFWCNLGTQVWQWFVLAIILCASGVIIIAPISMANDPYNRSWKKTSLSVLWLLSITMTTFLAIYFYDKGIPHDEGGKLNDLERLVQGFYFQLGVRVYLVFGLVLCLFMLRFIFQMCVSREFIRNNRVLRALTLPYGVRRATDTKRASTRKINSVLANAVKMHFRDWNGVKVTAAERFIIEPERSMRVGGLIWSWWNLLTRKLSTHHGIWLQSRLSIAQECQVIVLLFSIALLVWGADSLASDAERKRGELQAEPDGPLKDEALRFVPEPWVIKATFAFGGFFAISVAIVIILLYSRYI